MKKFQDPKTLLLGLAIGGAMALLLMLATGASAQTTVITNTNGVSSTNTLPTAPTGDFLTGGLGIIVGAVENSGLLDATNYGAVIYGTYSKDTANHFGGGCLIPFNFPTLTGTNGAVGMALGFDWLGHWSMVSGNVTLSAVTHPFNIGLFSFAPLWLRNLQAEPIALVGIGAPMSGGSGAPM